MIIRDAREDEIHYIRNQRITSYEEHAKSIPEKHWKALKNALLSDKDTQFGVECIVAELDGRIVGSVVLFPANTDAYAGTDIELHYPEIRMLAVTPEARGKGIAAALILECIRRAKVSGFQAIGLHTADYMESAVKLYQRIGFQRLPEFDFEPANDGIIVKGYRHTFE
jgi:ribosomal protein S18 acetylase RimI-like enzyme